MLPQIVRGAGTPQKGTAVARSCSACGLNGGDVGVSPPSPSPSSMSVTGLLQAVGLMQVNWGS